MIDELARRSAPVNHFIEQVLPLVDGGYHEHQNSGGHTNFILAAARDRSLVIRDFGMGHYFYRDGRLIGGTRQMVTNLVSSLAVSACASKSISKDFFSAAGVPVPAGRGFKTSELKEALEYAQTSSSFLVLKPSAGSAGEGVTCGISSPDSFQLAWTRASAGLAPAASLEVEEQVTEIDIRAYVVGGRVVAAATRLPAYVVGDGQKRVSELIEEKTALRARNAYLRRMPMVVDEEYMAKTGLAFNTVLPHGQSALLNETVNLHQGGENVDVTHTMSSALKDLAVSAAEAVPGLSVAGIDLMARDLGTVDGAVVLEANTKANISVHHLPAYGDPIDVAGTLVDEMLRTANAPQADHGLAVSKQVTRHERLRSWLRLRNL